MKKKRKYKKEYLEVLNKFELPIVYHFAEEYNTNKMSNTVKLIPSKFYQTTESLAEFPTKPVSKIIL